LAYGQNGKDSVYFFNQDNKRIENELFSPTFSKNNSLNSYGFLQLDFKHETGGFRKAQEAYTVNSPSFLAKGFNILGKFRIAGSFEFNKSFEDSLANGQRNNLEDLTTFYAFANKSGTYQRQNYIIKTSLSYNVLNHISPYLNLDYQKHWSTGSVDPRLSANRFIYKIKPGINVKFKNHSFGLYGILGKADEQVSVLYKNTSFRTNELNPDRIYAMSYGYGYVKTLDTSAVYKYDTYKGAGIQYATDLKNWNVQFSTEYEFYKNLIYDRSKSTPGFATVAIFNLNTVTSSLLFSKNTPQNSQQIMLDLAYNEGYDGNLRSSGSLNKVNYRVNTLNINATYHYLWDKHKRYAKELGFAVHYNQSDKKDLGQSDGLAYEQVQLSIKAKFYHQIDKQSSYKIYFSPYCTIPIETNLKFNPNSLTEFIRNVVFTDYYYYNSKALGAELFGEYFSSKLIKNQQLGFYAQANIRNQFKQDLRADLNPTFVPNSNRAIFHIGINLYL